MASHSDKDAVNIITAPTSIQDSPSLLSPSSLSSPSSLPSPITPILKTNDLSSPVPVSAPPLEATSPEDAKSGKINEQSSVDLVRRTDQNQLEAKTESESKSESMFENYASKDAEIACNEKLSDVETAMDPSSTEATLNLKAAPMTFPDGGFGWFVVLGAFMIQFCCWGFNFSWGVYQQYYVEHNIFNGATLSQISWSGGIGSASVFLTTPFQGYMVAQFGLKKIIVAGILISGSGMILASFATSLWQLYLTQGFMYGLGAGMALFTSVAIPVQWFEKRRGLASGITVAGSGVGGATLAPLNRYLISRLGHQWALRIVGIAAITIVCSVLPCIRTRVPPKKRGGPLFDVSMFKHMGFTLMFLMGMFVTFGYLTPIFLMPEFVTDIGLDPTVGANLVGAFAGVNAFSRVATGFVADVFGPLNILILTSALSGLACYMFWMTAKNLTMVTVFMIFYGINAGGFNSLFPVVAANVIGVEALAASVGLLYSGNFFGNLFGTPLASALIAASNGSYIWAQAFAGLITFLGACLPLFIRFKEEKRIFVRM